MNTSTALKVFRDYQKSNLKPSTLIGYPSREIAVEFNRD